MHPNHPRRFALPEIYSILISIALPTLIMVLESKTKVECFAHGLLMFQNLASNGAIYPKSLFPTELYWLWGQVGFFEHHIWTILLNEFVLNLLKMFVKTCANTAVPVCAERHIFSHIVHIIRADSRHGPIRQEGIEPLVCINIVEQTALGTLVAVG